MNLLLKFLSFFWDIPIEKSSSKQNSYLEVVWTNGKKMLNTRHANFSFGNGFKVFQKACSLIKSEIHNAENILVLGFGCGSIHTILREQYNYQKQIDGIEYDQKIINLFWKHFTPQETSNLNVMLEDAQKYLKQSTQQYDIVFVDLFEELNNVEFVFHRSFLADILKSNPKTIVFNLTSQTNKDKDSISELILNLSSNFKDVSNTKFQDLNQIVIAK